MPFITRQGPTGRQLFRTVCVTVAAGWVVGGGLAVLSWRLGYEPEFADALIVPVMAAVSAATLLAHYPWTPKYAASMGCRPG